jgi:hypothetical protein
MDNPQETDLIWLAGFLDGEGSFGVNATKRKNGKFQLLPAIQVASTEPRAVLKIKKIFEDNEIAHYTNGYMSLEYRNAKPAYSIRLGRLSMIARLLDLIRPYLVVKDAQADLLREYVRLRMEAGAKQGSPIGQESGPKEWAIFEKLREINKKGSSQAIRKAPDRTIIYQDDDMVGPTVKAAG